MPDRGTPKVTSGEIVIMASGVVALVFSLLPWLSGTDPLTGASSDISAWGDGLFPLASLVPLAAVIMAVQVALDRLAGASISRRVGDFSWEQIHFVLAVVALVIALCYLLVEKGVFNLAPGYWMDLLASVGLVVGAVMIRKERKNRPLGGMPGPF